MRRLIFPFVAAVLLVAAPASGADDDPAALLEQFRSTALDIESAVSLRGVQLEMGPALFEVERGILVPTRLTTGQTVELVFVGQARFRLAAPDDIEAGQLELFTGERSLEAPVEEAVLVLAHDEAIALLLDRPPPHEMRGDMVRRIERLYTRWTDSPERRRAGVEAAVFKTLAGDEAYRQYFAIWCRSFELGDFVFQLDPEDVEPVTLASFRPLDLSGWERARMRHQIRVQQRKQRWLDVRLEDLGSWDIWLSTAWNPEDGSLPGTVGFEAKHYELDVTVRKSKYMLQGTARLHLDVQTSGRRAVRLELMNDLPVQRVVDGTGRELFFFRSSNELVVHLPQPSRAGETMILEVDYGGRALNWVHGNVWDLAETSNWYPHCGSVDRATYDVTLRWPKKREVVASGRLVASGRVKDYRWERRRLDVPSIAFSFVLGDDYTNVRRQVGHVDVTVAFSRSPKGTPSEAVREQTLDTVGEALEFFEAVYGPYPLDELTLVTVPRAYSQSFLGFITLAESTMLQNDPLGAEANWHRSTTIAHELAHQWWGNLVGWWSYRDQWLSEGMANYSALLFDGHRSGPGSNRLALMSAGWRDSLSQITLEGRTIESLGPIVLGNRLNSSRANNAYRTIVYRKGAVVLAMLARAVGEERFVEMLHSLTEAAAHKVLTTESFILALEKMSGLDLDGFAGQYVYGTGIPEVYYGYETAPAGSGGWTLTGEARLLAAPRYGHRIVSDAAGRWDVVRTPGPRPGARQTTLMVPYSVTLNGAPATERRRAGRSGQLFLEGRHDAFTIETDFEPIDLRLDPAGEILAWFYSEARHPKRVLRYEAADLALDGDLDAAETRYHEALRLPADTLPDVDPLAPAENGPRIDGRIEDLKIQLALVRIQIEQGRDPAAVIALDEVEAQLGEADRNLLRMERDTLRARLELRRGEVGAAHRRLKRTLRIASVDNDAANWRDLVLKLQLNAERLAVTEAYTLLAITAFATNNVDDHEWAMREARDRGVDIGLLAAESGWNGS